MGNSRNLSSTKYSDPRGGHIRMYWEILDSNAWRCLSAADQRAYIALQRQLRSTNNGDLSLPLTVASRSNIKSSATLAKSLRALVAVGLVAVTRKGGCKQGGQRQATLYRLTDHEAYAQPKKNLEAFKATNDWKAVTNLAIGAAKIQKAEDDAKMTQLQKLAGTASKNKAVGHLTASKVEVCPPSPTSSIEAGETADTGLKPNIHAGVNKSTVFSNSENHTSNIEVLSTVATPTGELGPGAVGPAVFSISLAGPVTRGARPTERTRTTPPLDVGVQPEISFSQQYSTSGINATFSSDGNALGAHPTEWELSTAIDCDDGEDFKWQRTFSASSRL